MTLLTPPAQKAALLSRLKTEALGTPAPASVIEALEFRRDQYGLTQRDFAEVLGLGASHYSEIKNGRRPLPIDATRRAFALGVPAALLLQPQPSEDTTRQAEQQAAGTHPAPCARHCEATALQIEIRRLTLALNATESKLREMYRQDPVAGGGA